MIPWRMLRYKSKLEFLRLNYSIYGKDEQLDYFEKEIRESTYKLKSSQINLTCDEFLKDFFLNKEKEDLIFTTPVFKLIKRFKDNISERLIRDPNLEEDGFESAKFEFKKFNRIMRIENDEIFDLENFIFHEPSAEFIGLVVRECYPLRQNSINYDEYLSRMIARYGTALRGGTISSDHVTFEPLRFEFEGFENSSYMDYYIKALKLIIEYENEKYYEHDEVYHEWWDSLFIEELVNTIGIEESLIEYKDDPDLYLIIARTITDEEIISYLQDDKFNINLFFDVLIKNYYGNNSFGEFLSKIASSNIKGYHGYDNIVSNILSNSLHDKSTRKDRRRIIRKERNLIGELAQLESVGGISMKKEPIGGMELHIKPRFGI